MISVADFSPNDGAHRMSLNPPEKGLSHNLLYRNWAAAPLLIGFAVSATERLPLLFLPHASSPAECRPSHRLETPSSCFLGVLVDNPRK